MNPSTGSIEEITRDLFNTSEKTVMLDIDPITLKTEAERLGHTLNDLSIPKSPKETPPKIDEGKEEEPTPVDEAPPTAAVAAITGLLTEITPDPINE